MAKKPVKKARVARNKGQGTPPLVHTFASKAATRSFEDLPPDARCEGVEKALVGATLDELPPFRPARRVAEAYLTASLKHTDSKDIKAAAAEALRTGERPVAYNYQTWTEGIALARKAYRTASTS